MDQAIGAYQPGDCILNRFEIRECIGRGGMSLVYRAHDRNRQAEVALKFLSPALLLDPEARDRFLNEARISIRLQHPNILHVYEVHEEQGTYFLSMELLRGENLRERMGRWAKENHRLTISEILRLLLPVADALAYAHQFTIHRDVKPENIGIDENNRVCLMDFGLAEVMRPDDSEAQRHTLSYVRVGTPYYMAPEQLKSRWSGDGRSDQFSLAVVAYELFTGEVPLGLSKSLTEQLPPKHAELGTAIDRALSNDVDRRYPDLIAFRQAMERGAQPQFNLKAWVRHYHREMQYLAWTLLFVAGVLIAWGATQWIGQNLKAQQVLFDEARAIQADANQRSIELATHLRENRTEMRWLEREFALEKETWDNGVTNANQWAKLITASNDFQAARFLWEGLQPQLTGEGFPLILSSEQQFAVLNPDLSHGEDAIRAAIARSNRVWQAQKSFEQREIGLQQAHEERRLEQQLHRLLGSAAAQQAWLAAWQSTSPLATNLTAFANLLKQQTQQQFAQTTQALEDWDRICGPKGAPDLSFLANPQAQIERAKIMTEEGDLAGAYLTLGAAESILLEGIRDVETLHQRSASVWDAAVKKIETDYGMRFIHISGEHYWSIWEVRLMDFAHYLQEFPERSLNVGSFWKDPGYPQGPTHPVVGIDQKTAQHFATWAAYGLRFRHPASGTLPTLNHWRAINNPPRQTPTPIGLYPSRSEWDSNHFELYYSDNRLDRAAYTRPVASEPPSDLGLFDVNGNVWEWCADLYDFPANYSMPPERDTWILLGGNPHQQTSYQVYAPPPGTVWVIPKYSIGFRITLAVRNR